MKIPVPGYPGIFFLGQDHTNEHVVYEVHLEVDGQKLDIPIPDNIQGIKPIADYCLPIVDEFRKKLKASTP